MMTPDVLTSSMRIVQSGTRTFGVKRITSRVVGKLVDARIAARMSARDPQWIADASTGDLG